MCGVLGLPLMLCGGRSIWIGAGIFHCGDIYGGFWSGSGEMRLTGGFWDIVGCLWLLGVVSLWRWGTLGYCYSHNNTSFLSPLSGLPLSVQ